MSAHTTEAPAPAIRRAMACPIPLPPPVTMAVRPSKRNGSVLMSPLVPSPFCGPTDSDHPESVSNVPMWRATRPRGTGVPSRHPPDGDPPGQLTCLRAITSITVRDSVGDAGAGEAPLIVGGTPE